MLLLGLFTTSLLAATLLPGGSEIALVVAAREQWSSAAVLIAVATLGNTLGSLITLAMGAAATRLRTADELATTRRQKRALTWLRRFGSWPLLMAWAPVVGDLLCLAAGWLRIPLGRSTAAIAAGKLARYVVVVAVWAP